MLWDIFRGIVFGVLVGGIGFGGFEAYQESQIPSGEAFISGTVLAAVCGAAVGGFVGLIIGSIVAANHRPKG